MALSTAQLRALSHGYDRWQSGDASERAAVQQEMNAGNAETARAFALMCAQANAATAAALPPISQAVRDAAVLAGSDDLRATTTRVAATARGSGAFATDTPSTFITQKTPTSEPHHRKAGEQVGPYRLISELGRGGMGVVWLAERADGTHARQVALKMPLVENLNWLLAARFARERNILASLEHPGIARLYDAGIDQSTQPYIAIEYVAGTAIHNYVRDHRLKTEAIVELFTCVIDAVAHAHAQLVIHRDIKPSNILVDGKGAPHLLDFGIAKLLDDDDTTNAEATQLTRLSGRALTLDYASPEQVNNSPLGVASDVYALGVVLYELLTGSRPYRFAGFTGLSDGNVPAPVPTRREIELAILEQAPLKPSEHGLRTGDSESGKSARRLRGDLDTIVLKALRKDPKLRYASAQAFADDLRRYLALQPIHARPDGALYRITKFIRRQRLPLAFALVSGLAVIGLSWRAWQQQSLAQASVARAQSIDGLLQTILQGMSPDVAANRNLSAKDLLDRAQSFMSRDTQIDDTTRHAASLRMADLYREIGAFPEAIKIHENERAQAQAAGSAAREMQALWNLANLETKAGRFDAAASTIDRLRSRFAVPDAPGAEMHGKLNLVEGNLALVRQQASVAMVHFQKAEASFAAEAHATHARDATQGFMAWALQGQGSAATALGRPLEAHALLLRAHALYGRAGATQRIDQLQTDFLIAEIDVATGHYASALTRLTAVLPEFESRLGAQDDYVLSSLELVATAQMRSGLAREAAATLARLSRANVRADPNVTRFAAIRTAQLSLYNGDAASAEAALATTLAGLTAQVDVANVSDASRLQIRRIHAEALLRGGRTAEALVALSDIDQRHSAALTAEDSERAITRVLLACAQAKRGDLSAARNSVNAALPVLQASRGAQYPATLLAQSYAAIFNATSSASANELATRVERELGWQAGAASLAAWLRSDSKKRDWADLPVLL